MPIKRPPGKRARVDRITFTACTPTPGESPSNWRERVGALPAATQDAMWAAAHTWMQNAQPHTYKAIMASLEQHPDWLKRHDVEPHVRWRARLAEDPASETAVWGAVHKWMAGGAMMRRFVVVSE